MYTNATEHWEKSLRLTSSPLKTPLYEEYMEVGGVPSSAAGQGGQGFLFTGTQQVHVSRPEAEELLVHATCCRSKQTKKAVLQCPLLGENTGFIEILGADRDTHTQSYCPRLIV